MQHRNQLQPDDDRQDEDAHRPLVGRQLEIQVRQRQQPDEGRHRARQVRKRHVPHFHRLHADDEGVDERTRTAAAWWLCGRLPARRRAKCIAYATPAAAYRSSGSSVQRDVGA